MKNEKLINAIGSIVIIGAAVMSILHIPFADLILVLAFAGTFFYQSWQVTQLKKRIKELEGK